MQPRNEFLGEGIMTSTRWFHIWHKNNIQPHKTVASITLHDQQAATSSGSEFTDW